MSSGGGGGLSTGAGSVGVGSIPTSATAAAQPGSQGNQAKPKMAIEHSATVDKGLKMKIKRTKPGTKTSEAKHEIVKSNEQNGNTEGAVLPNSTDKTKNVVPPQNSNSVKRGSSSHRREKTKHTDKPVSVGVKPVQPDINGVVRASTPSARVIGAPVNAPGPPQSPVVPPVQQIVTTAIANKPGESGSAKVAQVVIMPSPAVANHTTTNQSSEDNRCSSPPPKKMKPNSSEPKVSRTFIHYFNL